MGRYVATSTEDSKKIPETKISEHGSTPDNGPADPTDPPYVPHLPALVSGDPNTRLKRIGKKKVQRG
jgi:hypothetical protein